MAGTLTFPVNDDLKAIVEHAANNDPGPFYGETIPRSLFLVKDQGVYLMSAGKPGQPDPKHTGEGTKLLVVYAEGHDPSKEAFDDWWELGRQVCGGDDFAEPLDLQFFRSAITFNAKEIRITMSENEMKLESR